MTAYGKMIVVVGGEPSSATSPSQDLSLAYMLDTSKIRYPNDQQIQQTPAGERVPGGRRPSGGEKSGILANRGLPSKDAPTGAPETKRLNGPTRESVMGPPQSYNRGQPGMNGNDVNGIAPGSAQPQGPGLSKLPRAAVTQGPPGPPPQSQPPPPRPNGNYQQGGPQRGIPPKAERGYGPAVDTSVRNVALERVAESMSPSRTTSPQPRGSPSTSVARDSPLGNGRRTPSEPKNIPARSDSVDVSSYSGTTRSASKSRQARQPGSLDSINEPSLKNASKTDRPSPPPSRQTSNAQRQAPTRSASSSTRQTAELMKELDAVKSRNAWYASELELARKAGYAANPSSSPILDQRAASSFDDDDRPLVEALLTMRSELANVQGSVDKQAVLAAKKIAEVEKQRDAAIGEAVYAKAKLAGHGGSQASTPQLDNNDARDMGVLSADRSNDIARKLAAALATQAEYKNKVASLSEEVEAEKRARQLADDTTDSTQRRMSELETYKQQNASEVESLKAELHEYQRSARQEATRAAEAVAAVELLRADHSELEVRHKEALDTMKDHGEAFVSLRHAIASSGDVRAILEGKLDEERMQRETIEEKLRKLRAEHEERTAELDSATRRLRDAEELAETHATEVKAHRDAILSGLAKITSRDLSGLSTVGDQKHVALTAQLEAANMLIRKHQSEADVAAEKLRGAEERIAGLEVYQEQASREGLAIRKQLQTAMREVQTLQAANSDMKYQLANQQLETNAVHVQHNTLKDILGERGISPTSAGRSRGGASGANTPDQTRLRDLEAQLAASMQAHQETKQNSEVREQEAESAYREKLSQLENDYQSAVHYVKGTEKMLKRMKDELARYKTENARMKEEIESHTAPMAWETERGALHQKLADMQISAESNLTQLEGQMTLVREDLQKARQERDQHALNHSEAQRQLDEATSQARADFAQLQQENAHLEKRAQNAEQKVSLLLDQVEHSVDNYRRQSRGAAANPELNGHSKSTSHGHQRNLSGHESLSDSLYEVPPSGSDADVIEPNARNSMALDSLATELETLRTHWETTNKNYRPISGAFDFEKAPSSSGLGGGGAAALGLDNASDTGDEEEEGQRLTGSLADWRKRLDAEEAREKMESASDAGTVKREMSPSGKDVLRAEHASQVNLI